MNWDVGWILPVRELFRLASNIPEYLPVLRFLVWVSFPLSLLNRFIPSYAVDADYGAALKPCGVLRELIDLSSAALSRNASEYCLQLSVLLQGPRGIGKTTTALNVANHLGLHFLEASSLNTPSSQ